MRFSIIVPIYNVEKYLEYCIESLIIQSYKDFEIILINDGSQDKSLEICENYKSKDNRIIVIDQTNKGVSAARNAGITIARGEYILFIDGDDSLRPNALEIIDRAIDGDALVIFKYAITDENNKVINDKVDILCNSINSIDDLKKDYLCFDHPASAWIKCVSNKFFNGEIASIRFNEETGFGEDQIYTCDVYSVSKKVAIVDKALYAYRQRVGSAMNSYKSSRIIDIERYINHIENTLKVDNLNEKEFKKYINRKALKECVSEVILICRLKISKKEKKLLMKDLINHPLFKRVHCDFKILKESLILSLAKLKMKGAILSIYSLLK